MSKIKCQAKDPSTCRYHTAEADVKFLVPKVSRDGTVLGLIEKIQAGTHTVNFPIERTYDF